MVRARGSEPHAGAVIQPERPFLGCFPRALSPSGRQMRFTRLTFTARPAARSIAVMRR